MRALAVVLAGSLIASGCAANSYRIPDGELMRLAQTPPEARGQRVRVVQEISATDVPDAEPVRADTQIIIVPRVGVEVGGGGGYRGGGGAGHVGGGPSIGGKGNDSKAAAIAFLVVAAVAIVAVAVVEGSRFDGWAQLHPMHPVHLIGKDGGYRVLPLAWIDPNTAAWTDRAIVKPYEGPWNPIERAPLTRLGWTYGMYGGTGSLRSADGNLEMGAAWTVQLGYFPTNQVGILGSVFFGWRNNSLDATLFETRSELEVQVLPVELGILHAGVYGGGGFAHRFEDAIKLSGSQVIAGDDSSLAVDGGAMFQLDIHTRLALTARLGLAYAHDEKMTNLLFGLSVY